MYMLKSMTNFPNFATEALLQSVLKGNAVFEGKSVAQR